jgi:hypothetical protein
MEMMTRQRIHYLNAVTTSVLKSKQNVAEGIIKFSNVKKTNIHNIVHARQAYFLHVREKLFFFSSFQNSKSLSVASIKYFYLE